ncbi:hypothetical protein [Nonomuraea sp. NPDC001023]|uniref:hypothetical protein n=1 Tax=unclassified Nonomuraea TaxID=2593643 RepID=UPI0033176811
MRGTTLAAGLVLVLATACAAPTPPRARPGGAAAAAPAVCAPPQGGAPPGAERPTTIDVVAQAYRCLLARYYGAAALDGRTLLTAGFAAFVRELNRAGHDLPEATMPALTGDDHARWTHGTRRPPDAYDGDQYGLGLRIGAGPSGDPATAPPPPLPPLLPALLPPLFVTAVPGGPAKAAGVRPGDVIESVAALNLLHP